MTPLGKTVLAEDTRSLELVPSLIAMNESQRGLRARHTRAYSWEKMNISLPDQLMEGIQVNEAELPFELALGLFVDRKATLGQASRLAGVSRPAFIDILGARRIPMHYDEEDLESDLESLRLLEQRDSDSNP